MEKYAVIGFLALGCIICALAFSALDVAPAWLMLPLAVLLIPIWIRHGDGREHR
jgi:hypothetical protein